jgi:RimJ/RimL family protein N-acetyltransferase
MNAETVGEDFLDFKCPYCGALNSFPTSASGLARECMNCMETLIVPAKDGEAARRLPLPAESARLRLRRFEPSDWQDLLEFEFEEEDDATGWLHDISQARLTEVRQPFFLAVEARDAGKVIGSLSLMFTDPILNQMEISLTGGKTDSLPDWESESFAAAFDFCFQELHLHRIQAQCKRDDSESIRIYQAAGMRQEAEFIKNNFVDGGWRNTLWFAMLAEEYFSEASPDEKKTL